MLETIWQEFLLIMREEVGTRAVETWFKAICLKQWDKSSKTIFLQAPNKFVQDWVSKNYYSLFQVHFGRLLHVETPHITFVDQAELEEKTTNSQEALLVPVIKESERLQSGGTALVPRKVVQQLNTAYTFETFIVGPSNSLAYAAAHAITEKPGILYNPLFIYGSSGLGKTHLLHAIGNEIKKNQKRVSILYQTADRFVNEFITSIRFSKMEKFKAKYQGVDVLLIDDLQFISNKDQTQEAFFHIFNSLYDARKQIVFSSDTYPQDMNGIADRLRSRIIGGLVTDIYRPSLETKIAILKKKAALSNEGLPDDVAHFIASQVVSNIRELEGALIRVLAFGTLTKQTITLDLAQRVLVRFIEQRKKTIDCKVILAAVCKQYDVSINDICSKSRNKELARARHVAMFLMKKVLDKSLRDIGALLGGRDHSTVMHALEKMDIQISQDANLAKKVQLLEKELH